MSSPTAHSFLLSLENAPEKLLIHVIVLPDGGVRLDARPSHNSDIHSRTLPHNLDRNQHNMLHLPTPDPLRDLPIILNPLQSAISNRHDGVQVNTRGDAPPIYTARRDLPPPTSSIPTPTEPNRRSVTYTVARTRYTARPRRPLPRRHSHRQANLNTISNSTGIVGSVVDLVGLATVIRLARRAGIQWSLVDGSTYEDEENASFIDIQMVTTNHEY
ncbi:hypothetical protein FB45DRAFT_1054357 [Roridomyces roridus]|uniref:Uncharacterized protein n=1 Tax=Roridomyces roridus TaxID=1738132 RepID=A0AAD7C981_9AGAR|nr:hypothetical protein FB45DRAFT_1054357 [Roridomyces roridus]